MSQKRLSAAVRRYARFHGVAPSGLRRVKYRTPTHVLRVGDCTGIMYLTDEGEEYIHRFRAASRPQLASSHDGKILVLLGGAFQFTNRGIVDRKR